ncbi:MAG: hypothetical protein LBD41_01095, partial [Clostridiales Family XIII bacterium]|nr:hypothetical protein [Clostridiales Family XIII bacterium]
MGSFVSTFAIFTLALSFWGRLALWPLKLERGSNYGDPLTLVAGGALFMFIGQSLKYIIPDFKIYLYCFFYIGCILFVLELIILC